MNDDLHTPGSEPLAPEQHADQLVDALFQTGHQELVQELMGAFADHVAHRDACIAGIEDVVTTGTIPADAELHRFFGNRYSELVERTIQALKASDPVTPSKLSKDTWYVSLIEKLALARRAAEIAQASEGGVQPNEADLAAAPDNRLKELTREQPEYSVFQFLCALRSARHLRSRFIPTLGNAPRTTIPTELALQAKLTYGDFFELARSIWKIDFVTANRDTIEALFTHEHPQANSIEGVQTLNGKLNELAKATNGTCPQNFFFDPLVSHRQTTALRARGMLSLVPKEPPAAGS